MVKYVLSYHLQTKKKEIYWEEQGKARKEREARGKVSLCVRSPTLRGANQRYNQENGTSMIHTGLFLVKEHEGNTRNLTSDASISPGTLQNSTQHTVNDLELATTTTCIVYVQYSN